MQRIKFIVYSLKTVLILYHTKVLSHFEQKLNSSSFVAFESVLNSESLAVKMSISIKILATFLDGLYNKEFEKMDEVRNRFVKLCKTDSFTS